MTEHEASGAHEFWARLDMRRRARTSGSAVALKASKEKDIPNFGISRISPVGFVSGEGSCRIVMVSNQEKIPLHAEAQNRL